jgi:hypothetical protein
MLRSLSFLFHPTSKEYNIMSDNTFETPIARSIRQETFDDEKASTVLNATSSLSFSVDQVTALFDTLVGKLSPVLTPEGPSPAEDPMTVSGSNNSHLFQQLLHNEIKLNYLAMAIQDVTRRVDL